MLFYVEYVLQESSKSGGESSDSGSANFSGKAESQQPDSPMSNKQNHNHHLMLQQHHHNNNNMANSISSTSGLPSTSRTLAPPKPSEDKVYIPHDNDHHHFQILILESDICMWSHETCMHVHH